MGHLEVEPETLRSLAGNLKSVGANVAGARQGLQGLNDAQTGDGGLSSAVHDFTDKWKYSLEKIAKNAEETGAKVESAAQGYSTTEQGIVDAARGGQ